MATATSGNNETGSDIQLNKRKGGISDWIKGPFERLNTQTCDFEKFAMPDDFMVTSLDVPPKLHTSASSPSLDGSGMAGICGMPALKKRGLAIPSAISLNPSLADTLKEGVLSVSSSCEGTPAGTPQGSPCPQRKVFKEGTDAAASSKKWFFFSESDANRTKKEAELLKNKASSMKFNVTNFDINAVGPTSW